MRLIGEFGGFFCVFGACDGLSRGDVGGVCLFGFAGGGSVSGVLGELRGCWLWVWNGICCVGRSCCGGCVGVVRGG